jgi:hypothetical protein
LCLAGCHRGSQDKEAVRQGILEHLKARSFNLSTMEMDLTAVQFNGNNADATVSFYPKGTNAAQGMTMKYQLQQQNGKWAVVSRNDAGGAPHGAATTAPGGAATGSENPHGGAMPGAETSPSGAQMPPPESLPPAGKKQ